ncbi:predicted protein [Botrytis cinerea T4]|uniref:Uncharacterized protein n=1 Tax=Botryotinia fuckeliana (strain T4) TaxID=999810 RepID=G2YRK1_BOTF4|nr:predicted protein [Botrytis cinerea T4]
MSKRSANEISMDEGQFPLGWSIVDEAMLRPCYKLLVLLKQRLMWLFNPSSCHQVGKVVSSKGGIVIDGSIFLLPSKPMLEVLKEGEVEPNYLDFLDRIEEAAHIGDKEKTGISAGIIHKDFVTIENAWENYVHVNLQSMLSVLTRREAEAVNGEQDNGEGEDGREEEVKEEVVKEELAEGKEGVTEGEVAEDLGILETPEEDATNDANSPASITPRTCHTTQIVSANGFNPVSLILREPEVDNTTLDGD